MARDRNKNPAERQSHSPHGSPGDLAAEQAPEWCPPLFTVHIQGVQKGGDSKESSYSAGLNVDTQKG